MGEEKLSQQLSFVDAFAFDWNRKCVYSQHATSLTRTRPIATGSSFCYKKSGAALHRPLDGATGRLHCLATENVRAVSVPVIDMGTIPDSADRSFMECISGYHQSGVVLGDKLCPHPFHGAYHVLSELRDFLRSVVAFGNVS